MAFPNAIDLKILSFLDKDARMPINKIAASLGVSRQLANLRLQRMETEGVILGHFTIFDSGVLGFNWYRVLIRLLNVSKADRQNFIDFLKKHPDIIWFGEVGGRWDIAVNFACQGNGAFNTVYEGLSEKFGGFVEEIQILPYVDLFDHSRSYLNPEDALRKSFFHRLSPVAGLVIDDLDKKIIKKLSLNARISYSQLEKDLKVSRLTIKSRIDKMIKEKIILGFRTFPRLDKIGYQSHMIFLEINKLNKERETELYYYLKMIKQVTFVVKHLQSWRVGLEIETKNEREFQEVLLDIRSHFSDLISDYDSFPLLQDYAVNYFPKGALEGAEK